MIFLFIKHFKISFIFRINQHYSHKLNFKANIVPEHYESDGTQIALYPYHSIEICVLFVYGNDFQRQKYHQIFTNVGAELMILTVLFVFLAAVLLCYLRRRNELRRDGLISCSIDACIVLFGGGNLQIHHKCERWFFGILMIGAFFGITFWQDAVLFPSLLIQDKKIDTFKELAKVNPPIFSPFRLKKKEKNIKEMLRFVRAQSITFNVHLIDFNHF